MRTRTLLLTMLGLLFAFAFHAAPAQAQATRTWISGVGDDVNPCSRTAPCKTFAGAISKTATGGEIDCIDPGGFGGVTITKAITFDCTGTHGSILVAGTNGITVAAPAGAIVIIRGLDINGAGTGLDGIKFNSGAQLSVEQCFIIGFTGNGVNVTVSTGSDVYVTNTYITNVNKGILANGTAGNTIVSIKNTSILNPAVNGVEAQSGIIGTITNSIITSTSNAAVITSGGSQINVDATTMINNNFAVNASVSGSTIRVSNSLLYDNGTNWNIASGATIASSGNNRVTPAGVMVPNAAITQQ